MTLLGFLDYAGVAVFAATGALAASRKQLDLIGFLFFAAATGIGGGTVRDLVLGRTPVFWVINPTYILVCVSVAVLLFFTAHLFESRYRVLIWLDALGLSAYCVMGAAKGLAASGSATVAIVTGVLTATFGGVLGVPALRGQARRASGTCREVAHGTALKTEMAPAGAICTSIVEPENFSRACGGGGSPHPHGRFPCPQALPAGCRSGDC